MLFLLVSAVAGQSVDIAPTVVLVSLDGFRWDYLDRAKTPTLNRIAARGVRAERLISVFPTKTFTAHYSIATGLYPESHGIVANTMYDPLFDAWFRLSDREAVGDGRWWEGEPIWVTAEKQGQKTAPYFWPGSEAEITGVRPSFWEPFDGNVRNAERIDQVLSWLDLPNAERPTFVTLYFEDVDTGAHDHDPEGSAGVNAAIAAVDSAVALLLDGLERRSLEDDVDLIIVSDHGMAQTSANRVIFIDDFVDLDVAKVIDWSPVLQLRPADSLVEGVYRSLVGAHPHLAVYRREEIPQRLHYRSHRRIAPIVGIADEGWTITSRGWYGIRPQPEIGGAHGYDPASPSMGGVLLAAGPSFAVGVEARPVQSIHLYSLFCHILGLEPSPNEGTLDSVRVMLRR